MMAHTITASVGLSPSVTADLQGFSPSVVSGPTQLSWDGDLSTLPELTFAADESSGCTEAQALAALSVSSGGLLVTTADAVTDGANVDFEAYWWLTDPVQGPTEAFHIGEFLSAASVGHNVSVGFFAFYLEDGETYGNPPPAGGAVLTNGILGGGRANDNRAYAQRMTATETAMTGSGENYGFRAIISRYARAAYSYQAHSTDHRSGSLVATSNDGRSDIDSLTWPSAARWRWALGVRRNSTNNVQMTVRIDSADIRWRS